MTEKTKETTQKTSADNAAPEEEHKTEGGTASETSPPEGTDASPVSVETLEQERDHLKDRLAHALADLENLRKRSEKEKQDALRFGASQLAQDLLLVADNLERALNAVPDAKRKTHKETAMLLEGVAITARELIHAFEKHHIRKVEARPGMAFSYQTHQAMNEVEDPNIQPGAIVQVFQPGYLIHDRLLRPAMVSVAKARTGKTAANQTQGKENPPD